MKAKLGLVQSESTAAMVTTLESEGVKEIQQENANLNKMVSGLNCEVCMLRSLKYRSLRKFRL